MKVLTKEDINNISHWLFSNGRDVDVARYNCLFYKDPKELVLSAITLYQNEDGGFGKGIEPDLQNQNSNVIATATFNPTFKSLELVRNVITPSGILCNISTIALIIPNL